MRYKEKNYYKTLNVDTAADQEIITAAYKKLAKKYHPDKNASSHCTHIMQEINEAYDVLRSPLKRAQYDNDRMSKSMRSKKFNNFNDSTQTEIQKREFHPDITRKNKRIKLLKFIVIFFIIVVCSLFLYKIYSSYSKFINSTSSNIVSKSYRILMTCDMAGKGCDKNGSVRIWADMDQTEIAFLIPPQTSHCVATKQIINNDKKMWWIYCGQSEGKEPLTIQGWVAMENLIFTSKNKLHQLF